MENVKVIIQKVIAILTAFIIIMSQYVVTGLIETTYAIDLLATQSDNVQFRAYFKNGEEELTEIEREITAKDIKLKIDIAVKNEGYFNGQISLENAGFRLTQATENNYIREVKDNIIYLNQINAEETASIEVGIEFLEEDEIPVSTLREATTVKLKGTYTSSKGNVEIDSGSNVKVIWKKAESTKAELAAKLQTNEVYKVNEENKKVVQFLISSKLTNNEYPIKTTEIKATIPEGATKVEVQKRTTKSTNGEKEFTEANYSTENNILTINVNNNETEGKISWMKGVQDIYVVTYEYPESTDLSTQNITINEAITTYDIDNTTGNNIVVNAEQVQVSLSESKDGIASVSKQEGESNIYKGKIYSGEGRDITSYTMVYVDYVDGVKDIEISEEETKYAKKVEENGTETTEESNANVEIKTLKINKEKVANILGEDWNLTIGETVINKETTASENGDIELQMPEGTKTITIKTSKPIKNGSFVIETTKTILDAGYTREQLKEFTHLKDSSSIKYTKNDDTSFIDPSPYYIELKETESKASINMNVDTLTSEKINENVKITTTLLSNNESKDLYKNPKVKIILPKQVKNVTITDSNLLFSNGLSIKETKVITENEKKVIYVDIEGTQNKYNIETLEGTNLIVYCNLEIDAEASSANEEIVLNYTNEYASTYGDNGQQKVPVRVYVQDNNSQQEQNNQNQQNNSTENSVIIEDLKVFAELKAYVGGEEIKAGDEVKAGEILQYELNITNNSNSDINNLGLDINIPEGVSLIDYNPEYPRQNPEQDGAYYVDGDFFATKQNNTIIEQGINVKTGKTYTFKYMVETNKDLTEQKNIEMNVIIKKDESNKASLKLQNKIIPSNLKVAIRPLFRKYGDELEAGIDIEYLIEIQNLTNTNQENIKVEIQKNDVITISKTEWYIVGETEENTHVDDKDIININNIPAKGKAEIIIDSKDKINSDDIVYAQIFAKVQDSAENMHRTNILKEKVKGLKIEATIEKEVNSELSNEFVKPGDTIKYIINIKNTGYMDAEKLEIEDYFSQYLTLKSLKLNGNTCEYNIETIVSEEYNKIKMETELKSKKNITIEIVGEVNEVLPEKNILNIINKLVVYGNGLKQTETEEIINKIEQKEYENKDNNEEENKENDNSKDNNDNSNDKSNDNGDNNNSNEEESKTNNNNSISGIAWLDENENGKREENEKLLKDITVALQNLDGKDRRYVKTQENGEYIFENVENGRYIIIFEYDTKKYVLTTYKASGVEQNINSDVENVTMTINGENKNVASTDTLNIKDNSLNNIDIGLKLSKVFDLELDKNITKITVANSSGTKVNKYKNVDLAKVEIKSKYINGSIVKIEYKIKVTNKGKIAGYAKKIVDYKPNDLEFNSRENPNWKESGNSLYSESLANTIINPGESKEVTLVLTKKMTNNNTGLTNNMAEITEDYNVHGISDVDSKPNNKKGNEDDLGQANAIISISTGKNISYIIMTLLITIGIGILAYINLRKIIYKRINC